MGKITVNGFVLVQMEKDYEATFTRKYNPKGTMFFCIPYDVEIIGYLQII